MLYHEQDLSYFTYPELPIFNLTTSKKDLIQEENISLLMERFQIPKPVYCKQVHGDQIVLVNKFEERTREGDALITQARGVPLIIRHADCQAAILYDPLTESLAVVHSGWRGSNLNIYAKVVRRMHQEFGAEPKDLIAVISPSLGPKNAEFKNFEVELDPDFVKYQEKPTYFNFWDISRDQLLKAGVRNISIASLCTFANPDKCFSYRRNKTTERDATIAML